MDQQTQMKLLLEAVDAPKVDEPKDAYANTPNEQTLDSKTQQDFGRDLNKKKPRQFKYKQGDNSRAAKMQEYKLQEDRLTKAFKKFKLNEDADGKWATKRELAGLLDDAIKSTGVLDSIISPSDFNEALAYLMDSNWEDACFFLMQNYTDHNGGEPRNHAAVSEDLCDDLEHIVSRREVVAIEATGEINHNLSN